MRPMVTMIVSSVANLLSQKSRLIREEPQAEHLVLAALLMMVQDQESLATSVSRLHQIRTTCLTSVRHTRYKEYCQSKTG